MARKPKPELIMVECVNAHARCYLGGPCPLCEPVEPLRDTNGRFVGYRK